MSTKEQIYINVLSEIEAVLEGEQDELVWMVTINSLLKTHFDYYYWVGFYLYKNGRLTVGPYQGTLGCIHIDMGKGVCGKAAVMRETQIVENVHLLVQGEEHIACDPLSSSEIVVPIIRKNGDLFGVFDVDSTEVGSFDEVDKKYLTQLLQQYF
jgi:L-methionine (R)-S-oxide reductase